METTIGERHSDLGQLGLAKWRSGLRPRIKVLVGLIGLMATLPGAWCFGSPSPRPAEDVEHRSTAKVEVPFQLFNDNLVIVKATIGTVKNVNMILDTGTNPSAISQELARPTEIARQNGIPANAERDDSDPESHLALYPDWPVGGSPH